MYDFYEDKFQEEEYIVEKEMIGIKNKFAIGIVLVIAIIIGLITYSIYKADRLGHNLFTGSDELIKESSSPSGKYTIKAYSHSGGATIDWAVNCDLIINNDEKNAKRIYEDYHIKETDITWNDENTVTINNHIIKLPNGSYNWKKDK